MAAGDVTKALTATLGIRLENPAADVFTDAMKLDALNRAQIQLCELIHEGYLTELETVETGKALTSLAYAISGLNSGLGVLRGTEGIKAVKVNPGGVTANAKWAVKIDLSDLKKQENTLLVCTDSQPGWYPFFAKINVLCTTSTSTTIDVYYIKMPTTISNSVDPLINASLHSILLLIAESLCWNTDAKLDRANQALNMALEGIKILNSRYQKAEGYGTQGRK